MEGGATGVGIAKDGDGGVTWVSEVCKGQVVMGVQNKSVRKKLACQRLLPVPETLPPEWIQMQVLQSPGSPKKRLPMHKKQHPLHPILPLD